MNLALWFLQQIALDLDPYFFYFCGGSLFILALLGTKTEAEPDSTAHQRAAVLIRKIALGILSTLVLGVPLIVALLAYVVAGPKWYELFNSFLYELLPGLKQSWKYPLAGFITGLFLKIGYQRYYLPIRSRFWRGLRFRQTGDSLSDIRAEKGRLRSKEFDPFKFYKKGAIFYGLDERNKPVYSSLENWKEQNQKIIGPTQTGKGVAIGVQLDQSIRNFFTTIFIDPKEDKHAIHIMHKACKDTNQKLYVLDLAADNPLLFWQPFVNGQKREKRARLHYAFGLKDTGSDSDYYKSGEREVIDSLWQHWNGSIKDLRNQIFINDLQKQTSRTLSYLGEWQHIPAFNTGQEEFRLDDFLEKGGVLYVKSSLNDETIIKGTTAFIMDLLQTTMRLYKADRRASHLFTVVDEVKFLITDVLSDSLATICGFNAHIALAYQSILDIRNIKDKSVNALSIEQSVNINCKQTLCYQAADTDTAEWASDLTGEVQKAVTRMEGVEINSLGGEEWEKRRLLKREAENYVAMNVFRVLPKRTGVFYCPERLAQIIFTCWVPVTEKYVPPLPAVAVKTTPENENLPVIETSVDSENSVDNIPTI